MVGLISGGFFFSRAKDFRALCIRQYWPPTRYLARFKLSMYSCRQRLHFCLRVSRILLQSCSVEQRSTDSTAFHARHHTGRQMFSQQSNARIRVWQSNEGGSMKHCQPNCRLPPGTSQKGVDHPREMWERVWG